MSSLRDLLFGYGQGEVLVPQDFQVYNTSTQTASNGGRCCLWTVPNNVTTAIFEIWSGGGGGGFGCCCMQGGGAGGGGYGIKVCTVQAGEQIRICAAGSTCCDSGNYYGHCGSCSFVCSLSGSPSGTTWEAKVCGGVYSPAETRCFYWQNCYSCCSMCYCCGGRGVNVDYNIPGVSGTAQPTQFCYGEGHSYSGGGPLTGHGPHISPNGCCSCYGGDQAFGLFPGGGGHSSIVHSNHCMWAGPGAGGLVYVLYY